LITSDRSSVSAAICTRLRTVGVAIISPVESQLQADSCGVVVLKVHLLSPELLTILHDANLVHPTAPRNTELSSFDEGAVEIDVGALWHSLQAHNDVPRFHRRLI
jgi:hypothetical protein